MLSPIKTRRSVRKYTDQPVGDELLLELLEAARLAPSGNNTQPWRFIIVRDPETKGALAKADHDQKWMEAAPVFIVAVADISCRIKEPGLFLDEESSPFALKQIIRDTAIAVDHLTLEIENAGLATCWTAWFKQKDVRPLLAIPEDKFVVAILPVGYPGETPPARPRRPMEEIVMYERWGGAK